MGAQPHIPLELVRRTTGAVIHGGDLAEVAFSSVSIDTRTLAAGALFFAIRGDRVDGHDFIDAAIAAGAAGVVVARGREASWTGRRTVIIEVDDPVRALGLLASGYRESFPDLRVVGITGSNGKTTTKEMIAAILARAAGPEAVLKTEGNLNNHLGVPLTLLRLHAGHRYAVVEMGMSALGEIEYLTRMARPEIAIVVCVAAVHLETLGTIENVARAKAEIWTHLRQTGVAVLPSDEPLLAAHAARLPPERRITFGPALPGSPATGGARGTGIDAPRVAYTAPQIDRRGVGFQLSLGGERALGGDDAGGEIDVRLAMLGAHNAHNAAGAAAVALALGIGPAAIAAGLGDVRPAKHRLQLVSVAQRTIVDDCYNASPLSVRAALDALEALGAPEERVAVLGDMLELGEGSERLHEEIGAYAAERVGALIAVGPRARAIARVAAARLGASRVRQVDEATDAARAVVELSRPGAVVLIKASRGMRLERVIDVLGLTTEGTV